MARLKVFRTPTGFHDAYVAATSRKAALAAWGADADLFARGAAEEVTEPALMKAPLAHPGEVIRVARGTAEEHLAALPPTPARTNRKAAPPEPETKKRAAPRPAPKREPRPSRADLEAAEAAVDGAEKAYKAHLRDLADREAALARERRAAERDHARQIERLQNDRDAARRDYDQAVAKWRA